MIISESVSKKETIYRIKCKCKCTSKKGCKDMHEACTLARREGFITKPGEKLTDPMVWLCPKCKKLNEVSN
jgi:hypothetical protein